LPWYTLNDQVGLWRAVIAWLVVGRHAPMLSRVAMVMMIEDFMVYVR
jgi:hypothetical protein